MLTAYIAQDEEEFSDEFFEISVEDLVWCCAHLLKSGYSEIFVTFGWHLFWNEFVRLLFFIILNKPEELIFTVWYNFKRLLKIKEAKEMKPQNEVVARCVDGEEELRFIFYDDEPFVPYIGAAVWRHTRTFRLPLLSKLQHIWYILRNEPLYGDDILLKPTDVIKLGKELQELGKKAIQTARVNNVSEQCL